MKTKNKIIAPMKKTAVLFSAVAMLFACGKSDTQSIDNVIKSDNLEEIRQTKAQLSKQQSELTAKIDQLDEAINRLDKSKRLNLVTVEPINDTVFKHYAQVQGDVATDQNIVIYPEFSGILNDVRVKEGERVTKGEVLATIDDGGLSSELAQLEAQSTLAKTTFERQKRLWNQNIGSEMQFLEAQTNYESMQNSVNRLKSQLAKTVIKAPFSGIIDEVMTEQGEVVNTGQTQLFRLVNLNNMYVEADIPESYLGQIQQGTDVKVQIASREFDGKVSQVSNTINPSNRTFQVKVSVPNEEGLIKPNQIATLQLNDYTAEDAIIVPENTVQKNAMGESLVYVLENKNEQNNTGTAKKVIVKTGYVSNDSIEITSGLQAGQTLIVEGSKNLRDGQEVTFRN
ncbi:efflux RND transporter periplasmic adaptor subunit [Autumnicola musiva]|uniref:Efflux RND transporter periplasmic adaptor subunit n=1 Tax=Autumnicola musiva TaxID=3075589 RepID=A0ABU3D1G2_9FLAO|nr:efflux RND transporter periplasmic adaptor subunit [Zunongwangia sp. F117]MDT0675170.1 efflux RND transporter periplasmic adaptor subunit [Zunongwangia sp. F117]